jgi:hypothetical protein
MFAPNVPKHLPLCRLLRVLADERQQHSSAVAMNDLALEIGNETYRNGCY